MANPIRLNVANFRQLRTSPAVRADLMRRAQAVANAAGPGFLAVESGSTNRARAAVVPVTAEAAITNARNNTLIRALDAGRN